MKDFKAQESESQSSVVEEIIQKQEDCSHRIVELYSHAACEAAAQICEKRCRNNLIHAVAKIMHERKSIEEFKIKFANLESTSTRQTQHYVRQLEEIQKNAIENIRKKKIECLKDIHDFKKQLMKQTYPDLESKFPHLYQKYTNQRFDTLNCNQVSWVMKIEVRHHNLKHTTINAKLGGIMKKFQSFKDVSKNLPAKPPANKQKVKEIKVIKKNPLQQHIVKLKSNFNLQKPNYSQDKMSQELSFLQRKKKEMQMKIEALNDRYRKLSDEIGNKIFMTREKQHHLKIFSKINQYHIENISLKVVKQLNTGKKRNKPDSDSDSESEQLSPQLPLNKQRFIHTNTFVNGKQQLDNVFFTVQINNIPGNQKNSSQEIIQHQLKANLYQQSISVRNQVNKEIIAPQQKDRESNMDFQEEKNKQDVINPVNKDMEAQSQNERKKKEKEVQANNTQNDGKEPQVKKEYVEGEGLQEWKNKELVQQIRKFGKNTDECLKVENIDGLRSFKTVRLPSSKIKINPFLKTRIRAENSAAKPSQYQNLASSLMEQQMSNQKEKDDKKQ